mmetsp:Transcript_21632/g.41281  ORF Transcript_21632/g.41281 Transcript_21632/m.41281 type:complete len:224 (+) Transcript_21632:471-1142(+)
MSRGSAPSGGVLQGAPDSRVRHEAGPGQEAGVHEWPPASSLRRALCGHRHHSGARGGHGRGSTRHAGEAHQRVQRPLGRARAARHHLRRPHQCSGGGRRRWGHGAGAFDAVPIEAGAGDSGQAPKPSALHPGHPEPAPAHAQRRRARAVSQGACGRAHGPGGRVRRGQGAPRHSGSVQRARAARGGVRVVHAGRRAGLAARFGPGVRPQGLHACGAFTAVLQP